MFFASLEVYSAYHSIPIVKEQRRFFCFLHKNQVYQYLAMNWAGTDCSQNL